MRESHTVDSAISTEILGNVLCMANKFHISLTERRYTLHTVRFRTKIASHPCSRSYHRNSNGEFQSEFSQSTNPKTKKNSMRRYPFCVSHVFLFAYHNPDNQTFAFNGKIKTDNPNTHITRMSELLVERQTVSDWARQPKFCLLFLFIFYFFGCAPKRINWTVTHAYEHSQLSHTNNAWKEVCAVFPAMQANKKKHQQQTKKLNKDEKEYAEN